MNERIKTEMISRRKAISLLGLGAALGLTLSATFEPLEAEAQEAAGTAARLLRRPEHTGCNGGKGGAPIAMSDAMAAMSGATSDERARNQKGPRPPQRLQRNRGSVCFRTPERTIRRTQNCVSVRSDHARRETADEKKRRRRRYPDHRGRRGEASCDDRTAATRDLKRSLQAPATRSTTCLFEWAGRTETHSHQDRAFGAMVRARGCVCQACGSGDGVRPSWGRNCNSSLGSSWSRTAISRPNFVSRRLGKPLDSSTSNRWRNTRITGIS